MDYAIQLVVIVAGSVWLGQWLVDKAHLPPITAVIALFLGIILGIGTIRYRMKEDPASSAPLSSKSVKKIKATEPEDSDQVH